MIGRARPSRRRPGHRRRPGQAVRQLRRRRPCELPHRRAARSWASSARTAPASRPSSASCAACCARAAAAPSSPASTSRAIPKACASTSATCRRNSRSTAISRSRRICASSAASTRAARRARRAHALCRRHGGPRRPRGRAGRRRSRAAGSSAWRSAARCCTGRPSCSWTSRPPGVEPASRRRFWDLIHSLAGDGVTVLVSTHYMDEAEYCNRVALINHGRLIAIGSPGELKQTALGGELLLIECDALGADARGAAGRARRARRARCSAIPCTSWSTMPQRACAALPRVSRRQRPRRRRASRRIAPSLEDVFVQLIAADAASRRAAA